MNEANVGNSSYTIDICNHTKWGGESSTTTYAKRRWIAQIIPALTYTLLYYFLSHVLFMKVGRWPVDLQTDGRDLYVALVQAYQIPT